jgi:hypothetical protein
MPLKKKIRFANAVGKPLVTVREIERVGTSKIRPVNRKSIPADLKKMKAKHEAALKRTIRSVSISENNVTKAQKIANNINRAHHDARQKILRAKNPENILKLKSTLNKLRNAQKNFAQKLEFLRMDLDLKKNKLKSQKKLGLKKSRFALL